MSDSRPDLDFKLSITRALADQLAEALRRCVPTVLTVDALTHLQDRPGVYQLLINDELVYIGKASRSLPSRLAAHARKLSGRQGFEDREVRFVCLYVDEDLEASAPETLLIKRHRTHSAALWNTNGFGNNDPGRRRDTSRVAVNHFDALHPINLDVVVDLLPGPMTAAEALPMLKAALPYLLRFEDPRRNDSAASDYTNASLMIPDARMPARDAIAIVLKALPPRWQATALPGYIILYPENGTEYDSAMFYWRSFGGGVTFAEGPRRLGAAEVPNADKDDGIEKGSEEAL
ncbi:MAG TPA: Eco29kI family restriction endonuclease [Frankiaceae bacterium]|nr:Eco29kI family restriction endonuclease [Frankiaceae bacterium]